MTGLFDRFGFLLPGIKDLLQILLVAAGLYYVLRALAQTRAMHVLAGILVLVVTFFAARLLQLDLLIYLMENLFNYGAIAALIVFQPELRSGLARLGQSRMLTFFNRLEESAVVEELVEAVDRLSRAKIGAIIAMERSIGLDEYAETGTRLQARVGADLVVSLFAPYGPLHDGAVLINGDTIIAAGVILPLTQFPVSDRTLGTRHRAAIGLSEETDALVIVVSEETSQVSVAHRGVLQRDVSLDQLRLALSGALPAVAGGTGAPLARR
ncbi:MAG TPA: diadenylate cyclase CdaA [Longimicrobiales bacterium]|nr:diadenylate cyclase CdaA [Longimicrobiales bacterium]